MTFGLLTIETIGDNKMPKHSLINNSQTFSDQTHDLKDDRDITDLDFLAKCHEEFLSRQTSLTSFKKNY